MATDDGTTIKPVTLETELRSHVRARVVGAAADLLEGADALRGLAAALEISAGLEGTAGSGQLRETAIQVRATALQAMLSASAVAGVSERLTTCAGVLDTVGPSE